MFATNAVIGFVPIACLIIEANTAAEALNAVNAHMDI